ncbi:MAG: aspartate-semialdehyde dehydrogenase [Chloroflexota bacterium]|jgi:aspartate-semialdehyde dehydrogenase|nr:aspartate-semialdehyde dehydrogenase [Chloroflexota bacterium]
MSGWPTVGVAGARGVVGGVFCSILADAGLPAGCLRAFGSGDGGTVQYAGASVPVHLLTDARAGELDVLFLAVDGPQSREIMAGPGKLVPLVVDNSSAFRLADDVPLVVPEANAHAARERSGNLVANPNCTTAAAVVALAPIRDAAGLASVDLASYQAVSGAGRKGLDAFGAERGTEHRDRADGSPFHGRIADSVVPQIDVMGEDGWTGEEKKIHAELRKILELPDLDVAATTVRVPVHTGHSVALHLRTERDTDVSELEAALKDAPGLEYRPADGSERHPMPLDVEGRDPVLVGRLRAVPGRERGFALWLSSDNLRKGAALNAIQVAAVADPDRFGRLLPPPR